MWAMFLLMEASWNQIEGLRILTDIVLCPRGVFSQTGPGVVVCKAFSPSKELSVETYELVYV